MPSSAVSLRSVVALVDQFPVLAGATLDIAEGEVVLLRGSNGAGKTSLLRLVAGLLPVTQGDAFVLGEDLRDDRRAIRRRVGFLGHQSFLYGELTAEENVSFFVRASGGQTKSVAPSLRRFGLDGRLLTAQVDRLSAGQRRRVALAVLAARDPELWLLDEPHAGLDAETRVGLDALMREVAERGRTVLMTSHESTAGAGDATRTVIIEGGVVSDVVNVSDAPTTPAQRTSEVPTHVA